MGEHTVTNERMLVMVPPHPLIKHWISVLRNEHSPCAIFKSAMAELGRLLIYEASRDWLDCGDQDLRSGQPPNMILMRKEHKLQIPVKRLFSLTTNSLCFYLAESMESDQIQT